MNKVFNIHFPVLAAIGALLLAVSSPALADGKHAGGHGTSYGEAGKKKDVTRTITITMGDSFFKPKSIRVNAGETVRFIVKNDGELIHEFALGTPKTHVGHRAEMMKMMDMGILEADRINMSMMKKSGMMHSDPNSILLEPNKRGEVIWKFSKNTNLELACNVPGHYEAGMRGNIHVTATD